MESHGQGYTPNSGRGRVALFTVILAKRGSPMEGQSSTLSFSPTQSPMWRGTDLGNMQQRAQPNAPAAKTEAPKTPASSPGSG